MKLVSLKPIIMKGWVIHGSVLDNDSICFVLYNVDIGTTIVRYFDCEKKAHTFLTNIVYGDFNVSTESKP